MTDESLVKLAAGGDEKAFTTIYNRHKQSIYNFAFRFLQNSELAEDAAHEVFLSVYEHLEQFSENKGQFKAWLFTIAYHRCCRIKRNRKWRSLILQRESRQWEESIHDPDNPSAAVLDKISLEHALSRLQEKYRLPIILTKLQGFSIANCTKILGISETNVKQRIYRGMQMLRKYFSND